MIPDATSRRTFLAGSAAAVSLLPAGAFAAGNDTLRVGLVGCGGRGTGAASQALQADPNVKLVAMCDAFKDRLDSSLRELRNIRAIAGKIDVTPERCFDGFDGYQRLLNSGVDVVLLCTPPGFRPQHLRAAIQAGKHVFCEKPVAVDATGVRSVVETARMAREKNLGLCSGFCYRYDQAKRETVKRIHDGMIGDVQAMHITYLTGTLWHRGENPDWTPMHYQMRNWYYYTWLSGDFIVEQHCHNFDKAAWVFKGEMPVACTAVGGRQVRTDPKYGHIYDHFAATFEYRSGAKLFSHCRQMAGCNGDVNDHVFGTKGQAHLMRHSISVNGGGSGWEMGEGDVKNMYQVEHDELFASIRAGRPINDGEAAANSTLMAILAREAAYSGKRITWAQMLASKQNLVPANPQWGPHEVTGVPQPGQYQFV
ncbi:Gfo/Idh/MocA family protein [Urbifossiella limnaea]|uniref:Inositol 2-dehydrogenase n=1 Tax=Urbifossiella limnaea TaxID=2528023 RepID=A0A517XSL4_9BACT|nr:Gfo/Idh/MocA family oxidoreductase [Urbifossiella limnaea]QDU20499.1 Inositol 2-dehydrogenase [Urbifossiella limnaea]